MKQIITVSAIALLVTGCGVNNPVAGKKVGQIVRVEQSGVLSKTWEAQIIRGGLSSGSGTMGAPFSFTIERREDVIRAMEYMEKQTEVILSYRTEGIYAGWRSDSGGNFSEAIAPASTQR